MLPGALCCSQTRCGPCYLDPMSIRNEQMNGGLLPSFVVPGYEFATSTVKHLGRDWQPAI